MKEIKNKIGKSLVLWLSVLLLLAIVATPAIAVVFAAKNSVIAKSIARGAVKSAKIADGAITSAKIKDGTITNADIAAGAAIAASKINTVGLNADTVDGKHAADFVGVSGNQRISGSLTTAGYAYETSQTRYLTIDGSAFVPQSQPILYTRNGWGDLWANTANPGEWWFMAPVNLPDHSVIKELCYTYYDNSAYDTRVELLSGEGEPEATFLAGVSSSGTPGWQTLNTTYITEPVVYSQGSYNLSARLRGEAGINLRTGAVTIVYQVAGP